MQGAPQYSRHMEGDMKQVPYGGRTSIKRHRKKEKISRIVDLASVIGAFLDQGCRLKTEWLDFSVSTSVSFTSFIISLFTRTVTNQSCREIKGLIKT